MPVSGIIKAQADSRCWRNGQEKTVYIYHFIVKDTVEEKILGFLEESEELFHEIIEGKIDTNKITKPTTFLQSLTSASLNEIKKMI